MKESIVVAVGGNSLIQDSEHITVRDQYTAAQKTADNLFNLVSEGNKLSIVHGNGPQVGFILRRSELAERELHRIPMDSCVADTQGALGYNIQMAMGNTLARGGIRSSVATVVTQVEVDPKDPAFGNPTKPIGSFMTEEVACNHRDNDGWIVKEDAGRGFRRVIPSPTPKRIVEIDVIKTLIDAGVIVIACGGGGIPVYRDDEGVLVGLEAVIDKDNAAALMAREISADRFIISTAVSKVCLNFGTAEERELDRVTVAEAERYLEEGHFAAGSMLPKIKAMIDFVSSTGNPGIITDPGNLADAINGDAGTHIVP